MQLIECPRDAMQGLPDIIPTEQKIEYINTLLKVGFHTIDFGSFVSAKAVPQMADTADVLAGLDLAESHSELLVIVANQRGFETARTHAEKIKYIGYPHSISETFQQRNTNQSIDQSIELIQQMKAEMDETQELVVYLSMGFGNPYDEPWNYDIVKEHVRKLAMIGVDTISLADTVGAAIPIDIYRIFDILHIEFKDILFGAHFHSRPDEWEIKVQAAADGGCDRFDTALLGYGGCPFAQDELVGNTPTEGFIDWCDRKHQTPPLNKTALTQAQKLAGALFKHPSQLV